MASSCGYERPSAVYRYLEIYEQAGLWIRLMGNKKGTSDLNLRCTRIMLPCPTLAIRRLQWRNNSLQPLKTLLSRSSDLRICNFRVARSSRLPRPSPVTYGSFSPFTAAVPFGVLTRFSLSHRDDGTQAYSFFKEPMLLTHLLD